MCIRLTTRHDRCCFRWIAVRKRKDHWTELRVRGCVRGNSHWPRPTTVRAQLTPWNDCHRRDIYPPDKPRPCEESSSFFLSIPPFALLSVSGNLLCYEVPLHRWLSSGSSRRTRRSENGEFPPPWLSVAPPPTPPSPAKSPPLPPPTIITDDGARLNTKLASRNIPPAQSLQKDLATGVRSSVVAHPFVPQPPRAECSSGANPTAVRHIRCCLYISSRSSGMSR